VLIWGPGPKGGALFRKRCEIREALRMKGHAAVFSEELESEFRGFDASIKARELLQACAADFITVIYGSPGAVAEVHDFGGFARELGSKMLIFVDSDHRSGYGYSGLLSELSTKFNNVRIFRYPNDVLKCNLLGAVEASIEDLRLAKWWKLRREFLD
jgi:hypothetical protein